ncbi:uncharacterized protein LOC113962284 [Neopelma chrysocephalum]|uniref:uncharacterized protein LOC113962284 n=1 Tax=Neopelma chrysocephalum TaxID=114329 RepID=UPI000FCD0A34|nr:uncharacterized protein LOC113962284 [Neopelma chrysocephalum]
MKPQLYLAASGNPSPAPIVIPLCASGPPHQNFAAAAPRWWPSPPSARCRSRPAPWARAPPAAAASSDPRASRAFLRPYEAAASSSPLIRHLLLRRAAHGSGIPNALSLLDSLSLPPAVPPSPVKKINQKGPRLRLVFGFLSFLFFFFFCPLEMMKGSHEEQARRPRTLRSRRRHRAHISSAYFSEHLFEHDLYFLPEADGQPVHFLVKNPHFLILSPPSLRSPCSRYL